MATSGASPHEASPAKNAIFVLLIVLAQTWGNLLLAVGMNHMPGLLAISFSAYLHDAFTSISLVSGTLLVTVSMFAQLSMYTWADLSYVLPVTASGYIVTAILSRFILQEQVSVSRWVGVALIAFGVVFVARTPSETKDLERVEQ